MVDAVPEAPYEGGTSLVLRHRKSISNPVGCSSKNYLEIPTISADMAATRDSSPSRSRSRSAASTTYATQPRQVITPENLDQYSPASRDPSECRYTHRNQSTATSDEGLPNESPGIFRESNNVARANEDSTPRHELASLLSERTGRLPTTCSSNPSSGKRKDREISRQLVPDTPSSSLHSGERDPQEPVSHESEIIKVVDPASTSDLMESPRPSSKVRDTPSDDEVDMKDIYDESESDDGSIEDCWVPNLEVFEAIVVEATRGNLPLAARLIPQLQEIFQREGSLVLGNWESTYRACPGNYQGHDSGRGDVGSLHSHVGRNNHRKRQRKDDEDNGEGNSSNQGGDDGDEKRNSESNVAGSSRSMEFACPFKKRNPEKYTGNYRLPSTNKRPYKSCDSGYAHDKAFKEHLKRTHRFVQCTQCSKIFTHLPNGERERALRGHQEGDRKQCCGTSPDVNEGISDLQWIEINGIPRKSRCTAPETLNVEKWNRIWKILFPNDRRPETPWHASNVPKLERLSDLPSIAAEFKNCYRSIVNDNDNEPLSAEETASQAFELWWTKRYAEEQTLQAMSLEGAQVSPTTESEYTPKEEDPCSQASNSANAGPGEGREAMRSSQTPQIHLPASSLGHAPKDNSYTRQWAATDTTFGYQAGHNGYAQTPASLQSNTVPMRSNNVLSQGKATDAIMYQSQYDHFPDLNHTAGATPSGAAFYCEKVFPPSHEKSSWEASTSLQTLSDLNTVQVPDAHLVQQASSVPLRPPSQPQHYGPRPIYYSTKQMHGLDATQLPGTAAESSDLTNNTSYGHAPPQNPQWENPMQRQRPRYSPEQQSQLGWFDDDDNNGTGDIYGAG